MTFIRILQVWSVACDESYIQVTKHIHSPVFVQYPQLPSRPFHAPMTGTFTACHFCTNTIPFSSLLFWTHILLSWKQRSICSTPFLSNTSTLLLSLVFFSCISEHTMLLEQLCSPASRIWQQWRDLSNLTSSLSPQSIWLILTSVDPTYVNSFTSSSSSPY